MNIDPKDIIAATAQIVASMCSGCAYDVATVEKLIARVSKALGEAAVAPDVMRLARALAGADLRVVHLDSLPADVQDVVMERVRPTGTGRFFIDCEPRRSTP